MTVHLLPSVLTQLQNVVCSNANCNVFANCGLSSLRGGCWEGLELENRLLSKLLYKSRNQHRSSKHYQHLCEVQRHLRLLLELQLPVVCEQLESLATPATTEQPLPRNKKVAAGAMTPMQMPSREFGVFMLRRLCAAFTLQKRLQQTCMKSAADLSSLVSRSHFLPLAMLFMGVLARLRVLLAVQGSACVKVYNALVEVVPALPSSHLAAHAPELAAATDAAGLPMLVKCSWTDEQTPYASAVPFPAGDSVDARVAAAQARWGITKASLPMQASDAALLSRGTPSHANTANPPTAAAAAASKGSLQAASQAVSLAVHEEDLGCIIPCNNPPTAMQQQPDRRTDKCAVERARKRGFGSVSHADVASDVEMELTDGEEEGAESLRKPKVLVFVDRGPATAPTKASAQVPMGSPTGPSEGPLQGNTASQELPSQTTDLPPAAEHVAIPRQQPTDMSPAQLGSAFADSLNATPTAGNTADTQPSVTQHVDAAVAGAMPQPNRFAQQRPEKRVSVAASALLGTRKVLGKRCMAQHVRQPAFVSVRQSQRVTEGVTAGHTAGAMETAMRRVNQEGSAEGPTMQALRGPLTGPPEAVQQQTDNVGEFVARRGVSDKSFAVHTADGPAEGPKVAVQQQAGSLDEQRGGTGAGSASMGGGLMAKGGTATEGGRADGADGQKANGLAAKDGSSGGVLGKGKVGKKGKGLLGPPGKAGTKQGNKGKVDSIFDMLLG